MTERDFLPISEAFYSIQCEGHTTGYPAYFIRLTNCNLNCGMTSKTLQTIRRLAKLSDTEEKIQAHMKPETGSWVCDSIPVWVGGHKKPFSYLRDEWVKNEILQDVQNGTVHLIWTGGEPSLKINQECIVSFLNWFKEDLRNEALYNEIETNGTQYIEPELFANLHQINCSAKLSNSGHTAEERIVPKSINRIMQHYNYWFKFVISTEQDIIEMFETYIKPFQIPLKRVICMPGLDSQEHFHERGRFVMEMAKKHKFIGMNRQHISAWDRTTGV